MKKICLGFLFLVCLFPFSAMAEVTPAGSFSRIIEANVPKGIGDSTPKLSLVYDSNQGNGLLGKGWSLAGLPVIQRINRGSGINFNADDSYAGHEGPLVKVGDNEYRAENDNNVRYFRRLSESGEHWWEIVEPNGARLLMGKIEDSIVKNEEGKILAWRLSRFEDPDGNAFKVEYDGLKPKTISYTENSGLSPAYRIDFEYTEREDAASLRLSRQTLPLEHLLEEVKYHFNDKYLGGIYIHYEKSSFGRPQPAKIYHMRADGSHESEAFEYYKKPEDSEKCVFGTFWGVCEEVFFLDDSEASKRFSPPQLMQMPGGVTNQHSTSYRQVAGDFDGDGKTDIAWTATGWKAWSAAYVHGHAKQFTFEEDWKAWKDYYMFATGDFDGDGKTDIAWHTFKAEEKVKRRACVWGSCINFTKTVPVWRVIFGNGSKGFMEGGAFVHSNDINALRRERGNYTLVPGDFNGDGKTDIALRHKDADHWKVSYGGGGVGKLPAGDYGCSGHYEKCRPVSGDFDGDGRTDIAWKIPEYWSYSRPASFSRWEITYGKGTRGTLEGDPGYMALQAVGDFDGDGRTDIAWIAQTDKAWTVSHGKGALGSLPVREEASCGNYSSAPKPVSGDFDGDGRTDIALRFHSWNYWAVSYGNGTTGKLDAEYGAYGTQYANRYGNYRQAAGDFDGDGRTDIAVKTYYNPWKISFGKGGAGELPVHSGAYPDHHYKQVVGDFDGDGGTDIAVRRSGWRSWSVSVSGFSQAERMKRAQTPSGLVTEAQYLPSVYLHSALAVDSGFRAPGIANAFPRSLVEKTTAINGDDKRETIYRYYDGRLRVGSVKDRAFLGFGKVVKIDRHNNIKTKTEMRQDYPFHGRIKKITASHYKGGGGKISETFFEHEKQAPLYRNVKVPGGVTRRGYRYIQVRTRRILTSKIEKKGYYKDELALWSNTSTEYNGDGQPLETTRCKFGNCVVQSNKYLTGRNGKPGLLEITYKKTPAGKIISGRKLEYEGRRPKNSYYAYCPESSCASEDIEWRAESKNMTYNAHGQPESLEDAEGRKTLVEYNELGRPFKTTSDGKISQTFYDDFGRVSRSLDDGGRETAYKYYLSGRLHKTTYPSGETVENIYSDSDPDNRHLLVRRFSASEALENGAKKGYASKSFALKKEIRTFFDRAGQTYLTIESKLGGDRLEKKVDQRPLGRTETLFINGVAEKKYVVEYDKWGRKQSAETTVYSNGAPVSTEKISFAHTAFTREKWKNGLMVNRQTHDKRGLLISSVDPGGSIAEYRRCPDSERVIAIFLNAKKVEDYSYDNQGKKTLFRIYGDDDKVMETRFYYHEDGRLKLKTEPGGVETVFEYDSEKRLSGKLFRPDEEKLSYEYYEEGENKDRLRITKRINSAGELQSSAELIYDDEGQVVGKKRFIKGLAKVLSERIERDGRGRPVKKIFPGGQEQSLEYDDEDRVKRIRLNGDLLAEYSYDERGRISSRKTPLFPDGIARAPGVPSWKAGFSSQAGARKGEEAEDLQAALQNMETSSKTADESGLDAPPPGFREFIESEIRRLSKGAGRGPSGSRIFSRYRTEPDGAFAYGIPFPCGSGKLSLTYDSRAKNGVLGVGWKIKGLIFIERVNNGDGINFDDSDGYKSHEGKLAATEDGEYRAQRDNGARYLKNAAQDGCAWTIILENGDKSFLGCSEDSIIKNKDGQTLAWGLDRVENASGGGFEIEYGECLSPKTVSFQTIQNERRRIEFVHKDREDKFFRTFSARAFSCAKRVSEIKYYKNGSRDGGLDLEYGVSMFKRSLLKKIVFRDKEGGQIEESFEYYSGAGNSKAPSKSPVRELKGQPGNQDSRYYAQLEGDFDGDGRDDIAWINNGGTSWKIAYGKGEEGELEFDSSLPAWNQGQYLMETGDFDGDGRDDIAWTAPAQSGQNGYFWSIAYGNGTSGRLAFREFKPVYRDSLVLYKSLSGDFDGDGKTDLALKRYDWDQWSLSYGSGKTGTMAGPTCSWDERFCRLVSGDFDGDGKTDIVWREQDKAWPYHFTGWKASYGNGQTGELPGETNTQTSPYYQQIQGDFDGDGRDDIAWITTSDKAWQVTYGKGEAGELPIAEGFSRYTYDILTLAGDFDGDGRDDIAWRRHSWNYWEISYGGGETGRLDADYGYYGTVYPFRYGGYRQTSGDFDGDGRDDIAVKTYSSPWKISFGKGGVGELSSENLPVNHYYRHAVGDFNGDGRTDIAGRQNYGRWKVSAGEGGRIELMKSAARKNGKDEYSLNISFKPAAEFTGAIDIDSEGPGIPDSRFRQLASKVETKLKTKTLKWSRNRTCSWRWRRYRWWWRYYRSCYSRWVKKEVDQIKTASKTFEYFDGRRLAGHVSERAGLGFARVEKSDSGAGRKTISHYRQDAPFQGMLAKAEIYDMKGRKTAEITNRHEKFETAPGVSRVFVSRAEVKSYDGDGKTTFSREIGAGRDYNGSLVSISALDLLSGAGTSLEIGDGSEAGAWGALSEQYHANIQAKAASPEESGGSGGHVLAQYLLDDLRRPEGIQTTLIEEKNREQIPKAFLFNELREYNSDNYILHEDSMAGKSSDWTRSTFEYYDSGRLKSAGRTGSAKLSWDYDSGGNLTGLKGKAQTYDGFNRLDGGDLIEDAEYDERGNRTLKKAGGVSWDYFYNSQNRLTEVSKNGSLLRRMTYGTGGGRVKNTRFNQGGEERVFYFGSDYEIREHNRESRFFRDVVHIYGPDGEKIASAVSEIPKKESGLFQGSYSGSSASVGGLPSGVWFYHRDGRGSVRTVTDGKGRVRGSWGYDPYGKRHVLSGSLEVEDAFTGQSLDAETGLMYYQSRHYDPATGAFLTPDTVVPGGGLDPAGFNRYAYARGNPVNYIDPDGHSWLSEQLKGAGRCLSGHMRALGSAFNTIRRQNLVHWTEDSWRSMAYRMVHHKEWRMFTGIVVTAACAFVPGPGAMACVAAYNAVMVQAMGGNDFQIMKAAFFGALTAGAMSHANTLNGGTVLGADGSVMWGVAAQKAVLTGSLGGGAAIMAGGNPVDAFSIGFGASMLGTGIEKFNYEYLPEDQKRLGGPNTELKPDDHPHVTGLEVPLDKRKNTWFQRKFTQGREGSWVKWMEENLRGVHSHSAFHDAMSNAFDLDSMHLSVSIPLKIITIYPGFMVNYYAAGGGVMDHHMRIYWNDM